MQPSLDFWIDLGIDCLENKIGVELGENVRPKITSKIPIYVPCEKITVKYHDRMWDPSQKRKSETKISKAALSEPFKM